MRDEAGRIRIHPFLSGIPVDGPEAMHLLGVRGGNGACWICHRMPGQRAFVVRVVRPVGLFSYAVFRFWIFIFCV